MSKLEKTLSIIKPDAVERNLIDQIKKMFLDKGFSILNEKKIQSQRLSIFMQCIKLSRFIMIFAVICLQVRLWL